MRTPNSTMTVRNAHPKDVDTLAQLWFDGWQDAHAKILPAELARLRTLEGFRDRLQDALSCVRVIDLHGALIGFSMVKGDELYQLYVSSPARGSGVAAALIDDAMALFRADGVETAWLACAIGNSRAARFYEKSGWRCVATMTSPLNTQAGVFPLEVWRYEISLSAGRAEPVSSLAR